jgi:TnsA endonuclease-like protein
LSRRYTQGTYEPINPAKYGSLKKPFFRSSWERTLFYKLDSNPSVIRWASEPFFLKYTFNLDQKIHHYYVDLIVEMLDKNKMVNKFLIEIKPDASLSLPKQPKNKTFKSMKNFNYRMVEYNKNKCKWASAQNFSKMNGSHFIIMTEKGIYTFSDNMLKKISEKSFF